VGGRGPLGPDTVTTMARKPDNMGPLDLRDRVRVATTPESPCEILVYGYRRHSAKSAHDLCALTRMLVESVNLCTKTWGWQLKKNILSVTLRSTSSTMGWAINTKTKVWVDGVRLRIIGLSAKLISEYDAPTIKRTILHELCHHWREERFPHGQKHDAVFCRELARVDPLAQPRRGCAYFDEPIDLRFQAQVARRRGVAAPIWTADAGFVELTEELTSRGRRYFGVAWRPRGRRTWPTWKRPLDCDLMLALAKAFPAGDVVRVKVVGLGMGRNLRDVLLSIARLYPNHMADLIAWLNAGGRGIMGGSGTRREKPKPKSAKRAARRT